MANFLLGMTAMAFAASGLFFLKFWRKTGDRFFLPFALSFWTLAIDRLVLTFIDRNSEIAPMTYLIRLVAFALILIAVYYKNNGEPEK